MNYLWQEFNIKTLPAETIVFKDGVYMPDLSTVACHQSSEININKSYNLPVHIIYVGEIAGENTLNINLTIDDRRLTTVFLTVKITNKKPAFLNIFIKNTGENSIINANIVAQNYSELKIDEIASHFDKNTGIFIKTRVIAYDNSLTKLSGKTIINQNCPNCESDMGFSVLTAGNAKIEFSPSQFISAAPKSAEHSAGIYHPSVPQIQYLRTAGMSSVEIKSVLTEAFINE